MPAGDGISLAVHAKARAEELPLDVVHCHSISGKKNVNVSLPDEPSKRRRCTRMHQRRTADHCNLSAGLLGLNDLAGQLSDQLAAGPLRADLV